jgi:hypothetical protein
VGESGERVKESENRANMCTHIYKWKKKISVEIIPGVGGRGIKDNGEGELNYDTFNIL